MTIGRDDLDKVAISLTGPFYVTASPNWGDSTPPARPRPLASLATLLPVDGQAIGKVEIGKAPSRLAAFAGQYLISGATIAEPGFYLAAIMMDNRDVLGQIVNLQGPAALTLVYKKGGGSVRGIADGGAGATVVLMADGPAAARSGWSAKCDPNGRFSFANLPPGSYTAAVFPEAPDSGGAQLKSLLSGRGERVKVEDGAVATTDLHTNGR